MHVLTTGEFDRTQFSAICADSFITSPSCPVRVSSPVPGILVASTNIISPPMDVHARPSGVCVCVRAYVRVCACMWPCGCSVVRNLAYIIQHINADKTHIMSVVSYHHPLSLILSRSITAFFSSPTATPGLVSLSDSSCSNFRGWRRTTTHTHHCDITAYSLSLCPVRMPLQLATTHSEYVLQHVWGYYNGSTTRGATVTFRNLRVWVCVLCLQSTFIFILTSNQV